MAAATFEYYDGSSWEKVDNYISLNYKDILHRPQYITIRVVNSNSTLNSEQNKFKKYQKIRVKDTNTDNYIFYGKISNIKPDYDNQIGQILQIEANDNLIELLYNSINQNVEYTGNTNRSDVIKHIINGAPMTWDSNDTPFIRHASRVIDDDNNIINNIDTNNNVNLSDTPAAANQLSKSFSGAKKNALRVIEELALEEPLNNGLFSYDYFLDNSFSGDNPVPSFNYFPRGSSPPANNSLILRFRGDNSGTNVIKIKPDYNFRDHADEIITKVRYTYVTFEDDSTTGEEQEVVHTEYAILIKHSSTTTLNVDDEITWGTNNKAIVLRSVDNTTTLITPEIDSSGNINETWLNSISGQLLTSHSGVTVNTINVTTPGSIREVIEQDIEHIVENYETSAKEEVIDKVSQILNQSRDVVKRGRVNVVSYPFFGFTMLRSGMVVKIENVPSVTDQHAVVVSIDYVEGRGVQQTEIELLLHEDGTGISLPKNLLNTLINRSEDSRFQTIGATGRNSFINPIREIKGWEYSGNFYPSESNKDGAIGWTTGTLTLGNGKEFTGIVAGTAPSPESDDLSSDTLTYIYFDAGEYDESDDATKIFQYSTLRSEAFDDNHIQIAWARGSAPYVQFRMLGHPWSAQIAQPFSESLFGHTINLDFVKTSQYVVSWTTPSGENSIELASGTTFNIINDNFNVETDIDSNIDSAEKVGRRYFIYFHEEDLTILQITSDLNDSVESGNILLATFKIGEDSASSVVTKYNGGNQVVIDGGFIAAGTISANEIVANTISAAQIRASTITADRLASDLILSSRVIVAPDYNILSTTDNSITNSSRIEIFAAREGVTGNIGIVGYAGDGLNAAVEQFRLDAREGAFIASAGNSGNLRIDATGMQIFDGSSNSILHIYNRPQSLFGSLAKEGVIYVGKNNDDDNKVVIDSSEISILGERNYIRFYNSTNSPISGITVPSDSVAMGIVLDDFIFSKTNLSSLNLNIGFNDVVINADNNLSITSDNIVNILEDNDDNYTSGHLLRIIGDLEVTGDINITGDITTIFGQFVPINTNSEVTISLIPAVGNENIGGENDTWNNIYATRVNSISIYPIAEPGITNLLGSTGSNRWGGLFVQNINMNGTLTQGTHTLSVNTLNFVMSGGLSISGSLSVTGGLNSMLPAVAGASSLGSSTSRFNNVYANNIRGTNVFIGANNITNLFAEDNHEHVLADITDFIVNTISGDLIVTGTLTVGNATTIVPSSSLSDLGSPSSPWMDIYGGTLRGDTLRVDSIFVEGSDYTNHAHTVSDIIFDSSLIPAVGNENIGSDDNTWNNIYAVGINSLGIMPIIQDGVINSLGSSSNRWGRLFIEDINMSGDLIVDDITLGSGSRISGSLIPNNNTYNLGNRSLGLRWSKIYVSNIELSNSLPSTNNPRVSSNLYKSDHLLFQYQVASENAYNAISNKYNHILYWWEED